MKPLTPLLFVIIFVCNHSSFAQNFAITANAQITNHSSHLSDYTDLNRLFVTLLSIDQRDVYQGILKVEIVGNGYTIKTKEGALFGQNVNLIRNVPMVLTGSQLRALFNPDNLDFMGLDRASFFDGGGRLKEGPVSFCFTVFDPNRQEIVSNNFCTIGNISTYDPPEILAPIGNIAANHPQNQLFTWQNRHIGAFATTYTLEIYENNLDFGYDIIINNTAPFFTRESMINSYLFTELDPVLIEGANYLVRVQIRDILGNAVFLNDGWSEIISFTYDQSSGIHTQNDENCNAPTGTAFEVNSTDVEVNWQGQISYLEYLGPDCSQWTRVNLGGFSPPYVINSYFIGDCSETPIRICRSCSDGEQCSPLPISLQESDCPEIENNTIDLISEHTIALSWDVSAPYDGYIIKHKLGNAPDTDFSQSYSAINSIEIGNLEANTSYDIQVCPDCSVNGTECKNITAQTALGNIHDGDCSPPTGISANSASTTSIDLEWLPALEGVLYTVEYALATEGTPVWYSDQDVASPHQIIDLTAATQYMIRICPQCTQTACSEVVYFTTAEESDFSFTGIGCGESYDSYLPPASSPAYNGVLQEGDQFKLADFVVIISTLTNTQSGTYSGTGIIGIPFGNKNLNVSFSNVRINSQKEAFSGSARGIIDTPNWNISQSLPPTAVFGSEICQEPEATTGWDDDGLYQPGGLPYDPNGFNQSGEFTIEPPYSGYQPGDPYDPQYDPNGFDSEGNHVETGDPFNPTGCNQIGLDADGQPCNQDGQGPYYWLNEEEDLGPITDAGSGFEAQINSDSLRAWIIAGLNQTKAEIQEELVELRAICSVYKARMIELQEGLGYSRIWIFGVEDVYINEGCSAAFNREPLPLAVNVQRNPDAKELELTHIDLYHKDKAILALLRKIDIIEAELLSGALDISETELREQMQRFSEEEVDAFNADHSAAIKIWVKGKMDAKIITIYEALYGEDYGSIFQLQTSPVEQIVKPYTQPSASYGSSLTPADLSEEDMKAIIAEAFSFDLQDDASIEYDKNWTTLSGMQRALVLKRLADARQGKIQYTYLPPGDGVETTNIPVEIEKEILGKTYTLLLDNIQFTTSQATVDIYMVLDLFRGKQLAFASTNVVFNPGGPVNADKLQLATDIQISLGNAAQLTILGNNNTFIAFDCEGFNGMGIDGKVEFCRKYLTPLNPQTMEPLPLPAMVQVEFMVEMPVWGEFILDVNIDPFAITKREDIHWVVHHATFDFSETKTPEHIVFPQDYTSPFVQNGHASPLWKGFYLQELSVHLPKGLTGNETDGSTIGVQNVIIDDRGFTGSAFIEPLLSLEKGTLGGWAFSIDHFAVNVIANQFHSVNFEGNIHIPLYKNRNSSSDGISPEDCFAYIAEIQDGNNYSFVVTPSSDKDIPLCLATATIDSTTTITIQKREGKFEAFAVLNGSLRIGGENSSTRLPNITYQGLVLSNSKPYFREQGTWGTSGDVAAKYKGFNIVITLPRMARIQGGTEEDVGFHIGIQINLTPSEEEGISACTNLIFVGKMASEGGRQKWVYDHTEIKDINIDASAPGFAVQGCLSFFDYNPGLEAYGKGFKGLASVWFTGVNGKEEDHSAEGTESNHEFNCICTFDGTGSSDSWGFAAMAIFGSTDHFGDEFNYFLIDVMVKFGEEGLPVGPINVTGFGGGVFKHMNREAPLQMALSMAPGPNDVPAAATLGSSLSGAVYTPDPDLGLGLKATVAFNTGSPSAFNANVTFEIVFNARDADGNGGGINYIALYGNCAFMEEPDMDKAPTFSESGGAPQTSAKVAAFFDINYDFENNTLHAGFEVVVNAMNGDLTGGGQAVLHLAPDDKYINIGWPSDNPLLDQRINLAYRIPLVGLATLSAYLDIGQNIPPMPSPPSYVTALTGAGNFMINESQRASGRGFAFGAAFDISTGRKRFGPFYADFAAGLGFDINLQNYGEAECANTGSAIGINGWYASGQAWAYFQGAIGIEVHLLFINGDFEILSIGAAAILQAKLPNPFWARGAVGGRYSILGGLVNGSCNFQVTLGEACQMVGGEDPYANFPLISNLTPEDGAIVKADIIPTVNFFAGINEPIITADETYTPQLVYARLTKKNTGDEIAGVMEMDPYGYSLTFTPDEFLYTPGVYIFEVKVRLVNSAGAVITEEIKTSEIRCFQKPASLPEANVAFSYPLDNQLNFYKEEYDPHQGYIQLKRGQDYLFNVPDSWEQIVRFSTGGGDGGTAFETSLNYDPSSMEISFDMPPGQFQNGGLYQLELINKIPQSSGEESESSDDTRHGGGLFTLLYEDDHPLDEVLPTFTERILYSIVFRVSEYPTFYDKAIAIQNNLSFSNTSQDDMILVYNININETFEAYEMTGVEDIPALMSIHSDLEYTAWFTDNNLHSLYNILTNSAGGFDCDYHIRWRDPQSLGGRPPNQSTQMISSGNSNSFSDSYFEEGAVPEAVLNSQISIEYASVYIISWDIKDLYYLARGDAPPNPEGEQETEGAYPWDIGCYWEERNENYGQGEWEFEPPYEGLEGDLWRLIKDNDQINSVPHGSYPVQFKYTLPGKTQYSTMVNVNLNY